MKNIHVLQTNKPSKLAFDLDENFYLTSEEPQFFEFQNLVQNRELYITSDEEITEGDWFYDLDTKYIKIKQSWENSHLMFNGKKIILTTDVDLIKDGVQSIDDEFLNWFVKNPSCEEVKVETNRIVLDDVNYNFDIVEYKYKIIIPKEEVLLQSSIDGEVIWGEKQETLEEAAERIFGNNFNGMYHDDIDSKMIIMYAIDVAKWQQEQDKNKYSEGDMLLAFQTGRNFQLTGENNFKELIEQFKKK